MRPRDPSRCLMTDAEVDNLRVGDVLLWGRKQTPRVVRSVKHTRPTRRGASKRDPQRTSVSFAIRRCSWTGRAYTVYGRADIRVNARATGVRVRVADSELALKLLREMADRSPPYNKLITCCDVIGVLS